MHKLHLWKQIIYRQWSVIFCAQSYLNPCLFCNRTWLKAINSITETSPSLIIQQERDAKQEHTVWYNSQFKQDLWLNGAHMTHDQKQNFCLHFDKNDIFNNYLPLEAPTEEKNMPFWNCSVQITDKIYNYEQMFMDFFMTTKKGFFFYFLTKTHFLFVWIFFTHAAILSMKWNLLFFIGKNWGIQLFYWKLFSFIGTLFVNISFSLVKQFFVSTFDFKILYIQYRNRFHIINREQNYLCYITMPFNHHNTNSSLIT